MNEPSHGDEAHDNTEPRETDQDAGPSAGSDPRSRRRIAVPPWYRRLVMGVSIFSAVVVVLVTLLVWAWRGTDEFSWTPYSLGLELLLIALIVTVGRKAFWRGAAFEYRILRTRGGLIFAVVFAGILLALVVPPLVQKRAPVADPSGRKVAVVGAGAAGLHAAWMLEHAGIDFDVYEAADYIGGHAYAPIFTPESGVPFASDIGFIFGSPTDYQEMKALMAWYGVERNPSELGISASVDGRQWACGPDVSPEAKRFHELAERDYQNAAYNVVPFGFWLTMNGFDEQFRRQYLTPLLSVLFITDLGLYEVSTRFMLSMATGRGQWVDFRQGAPAWTVKGGSGGYYEKLTAGFKDRIQLNTPVVSLERTDEKVRLLAYGEGGKKIEKIYDDVILGVPADVAHSLLQDADWLEDFVLGQVRYRDSEVVLHTDDSLLPPEESRRRYNYFADSEKQPGRFELTAIMNLVHGAGDMEPLPIASLNPLRPIDPNKEILRRGWRHHTMDMWHLALMLEVMPIVQGRRGVWYAGDWVTLIGHGPAMRTGMAAACDVGARHRVKTPARGARCIDVRTEDERAGVAAVDEHLCGEEGLFAYLVERTCNGLKL